MNVFSWDTSLPSPVHCVWGDGVQVGGTIQLPPSVITKTIPLKAGGKYPCQLFTAFFKFCGFQNEGSKWVSLMLSNKVVFLTQRYPKFKERCLHWNNFLRQGSRGGGRFRSTPCFFNSTPLHLVVPAQVLAVFSFFSQLVNHTTGLTQNATGARPSLFPWVSVDAPRLWLGECVWESSLRDDPRGQTWMRKESLGPVRMAHPLCQVGHSCATPGLLFTQGSVGCLRLLLARL